MRDVDLEFDIAQHFESSVELATALVSGDVKNVSPWRWVVIALHDAIYCALVMKLTRTDSFGVFPDKLENKVNELYERGLDSGSREWSALCHEQERSKLVNLDQLLMRANLASGATIHKSVATADRASKFVTLLKKRRDMFVHAGDYSLLTTIPELREICTGSIDVLNEILSLPGHRHSPISQEKYDRLVGRLQDALDHAA